jgi:hypothetical protein
VCVDGVRILDVFTVQLLLHSLCLYQSNVARALYACIASCTATAYWSSYVIVLDAVHFPVSQLASTALFSYIPP